MYRLDREEFLKFPLIFLWALMGFQAGFLNSFGFITCGRYISHVTGFGTQIGVTMAQNQWLTAFELIGFPLSFIFGSFFSGFFTCARRERGLKPRYDWMTLLMPAIIVLVMAFGLTGVFGVFGQELLNARHFTLLYVLSFTCGLQNGCFATLTKGQIRTTHLTGISTDIGTDFARYFFGKLSKVERQLVKRANLSRMMTFIAFAVGAITSVLATNDYEFMALTIPLLTSLVAYASMRIVSRKMDQSYGSARDASNENIEGVQAMGMKLTLVLIAISSTACSTTGNTSTTYPVHVSLSSEARQEVATEGSTDTKENLMEILNQDASITPVERSKLLDLVEKGFAKKREYEILANQKKALLVREIMKDQPNRGKIAAAKTSIEKLYSLKINEMMKLFNQMADVMKVHPKSSEHFLNRSLRDFTR